MLFRSGDIATEYGGWKRETERDRERHTERERDRKREKNRVREEESTK